MNKVVLITGGARGIGSAIALELAKHGYDIVINYLTSKQPAKELKEKIESQYHVHCLTICADVSDVDQVNIMVSEVEEKMGGVDILINNAAVDLSNLFHLKNAEKFKRTFDVNVVGAFNVVKECINICWIKNMEESSIYQVPTELIHIIQCVLIMMLQKQP